MQVRNLMRSPVGQARVADHMTALSVFLPERVHRQEA